MNVGWQTSVVFDLFTKSIIDYLTDNYKVTNVRDVVFLESIDLSIECEFNGSSTLFTIDESNNVVNKYVIPLVWNGKDYSLCRYIINYDTVKSKLVRNVFAILAIRVKIKLS